MTEGKPTKEEAVAKFWQTFARAHADRCLRERTDAQATGGPPDGGPPFCYSSNVGSHTSPAIVPGSNGVTTPRRST